MKQTDTIPVTCAMLPPYDEYCAEIRDLWDSHVITNCAEKHSRLESLLADYLQVPHVKLFANGHLALEMAIEALVAGVDERDEVITTPFTFASTIHAIVRKGLKPVLCDIRPDDCTIDPECIEALITPRTCAILPVHVYGNVCDVDAIGNIAQAHGLKVVYDAAHAFGVRLRGEGVASFGDASMFSFHATKVFNTIEGGAVAFADGDLAGRFEALRNFGISSSGQVVYAGGNAKLNEFSAAMGICNLRHMDEVIASRKVRFDRYGELLAGVRGLSLCRPARQVQSNYAYLPVLVDPDEFGASRDEVHAALMAQGVMARKYFFPLASDYDCYAGRFDYDATPVARRVADQVLCLPLYPDLSIADVERICAVMEGVR